MKNRRGLVLLAFACVLGLGAAFLARNAVSVTDSPEVTVTTLPVVVARSDLGTAAILSAASVEIVDWPSSYLPPGALTTSEQVAERVTRRPLVRGEPVIESALFPSGTRGGLHAVIAPDHRAVSVKVDSVIGVAGFVAPGSRVDVLATLRRVDRQKSLPYSKVILQDVGVLAIDQQLEEAQNGDPEPVSVVTLEVAPGQAQKLIYAAHEGRLHLALRTPGDDTVVDMAGIGVREVLGVAKKAPNRGPARRRSSVQVMRGSKIESQAF
jgi:pilus assembly protein CpaB